MLFKSLKQDSPFDTIILLTGMVFMICWPVVSPEPCDCRPVFLNVHNFTLIVLLFFTYTFHTYPNPVNYDLLSDSEPRLQAHNPFEILGLTVLC